MNVSKIHSLRVSHYDQSGMVSVNRLMKDSSATPNGVPLPKNMRKASVNNTGEDFEDELQHAIDALAQKRIDSAA